MREFCTSGSVGTSGRKRPGVTRRQFSSGTLIAAQNAIVLHYPRSLYFNRDILCFSITFSTSSSK
jgi:hypothetical protein